MQKKIIILLLPALMLTSLVKAQNTYNEITLPELMKKKVADDKNMVIVDVRSDGEFGDSSRGRSGNIGRIKGAVHIGLVDMENKPETIKQFEPYRDKEIYLICSHSYRSRSASNILLKNGFTHVNNVRGGMTEWYRRYDELAFYRSELMDRDIRYTNLSPTQFLSDLQADKNMLLLGIRNNPRFWWDSANIKAYKYYPLLKNTTYFNYADSLTVLAEVKKDMTRPVVLFSMVNNGAAELADWLVGKGIPRVYYLVGGINLFYEYVSNKQMPGTTNKFFEFQSPVQFLTPTTYCLQKGDSKAQWIDIRHDSLFNKVNEGVKHDFTHIKNAANFYSVKGAAEFEKAYPDKKKEYILINSFSSEGVDMADELARRGYKIAWITGGYDRWEWYMNNVEDFSCNNLLETKN